MLQGAYDLRVYYTTSSSRVTLHRKSYEQDKQDDQNERRGTLWSIDRRKGIIEISPAHWNVKYTT